MRDELILQRAYGVQALLFALPRFAPLTIASVTISGGYLGMGAKTVLRSRSPR
jgi:hypothetical protein